MGGRADRRVRPLHWSLGTGLHGPGDRAGPGTCFYLSGTTFFTLGFGDVTPIEPLGRVLAVAEAGLGFGFLAVVISYLPILYQAFSGREVTISLLDARAGSPPTAAQLLIRLARGRNLAALGRFLEEWERWAAQVLESHLSFPMLGYYRSQHDNQSWLAALTVVLDAWALVLAGVKGADPYQAGLTFAMARHAVVDLAQVYQVPPPGPGPDRLPGAGCGGCGRSWRGGPGPAGGRGGGSRWPSCGACTSRSSPPVPALLAGFAAGAAGAGHGGQLADQRLDASNQGVRRPGGGRCRRRSRRLRDDLDSSRDARRRPSNSAGGGRASGRRTSRSLASPTADGESEAMPDEAETMSERSLYTDVNSRASRISGRSGYDLTSLGPPAPRVH